MLLGHPLVPVVEHVQPLGLPLPQHLQGDFLQPVEQRAGPIRGAKRRKRPGLGPSHQSGQAAFLPPARHPCHFLWGC